MRWAIIGRTTHRQGDYRRATALLEEALALCRDMGVKQLFAWASSLLADVAHDQGNDERATALLEESLTLFRDIGDKDGLAFTLSVLGTVAHAQGDDERATGALRRESGPVDGYRIQVGHGDSLSSPGDGGARAGRRWQGDGAL